MVRVRGPAVLGLRARASTLVYRFELATSDGGVRNEDQLSKLGQLTMGYLSTSETITTRRDVTSARIEILSNGVHPGCFFIDDVSIRFDPP
jgi:hypothetical protein